MEVRESDAADVVPQLELLELTVNDLPRVWDQVEPLLMRACEYSNGEFTPPLVLAGMGIHDGVVHLRMLAMVEDRRAVTSVMVVRVTEGRDAERKRKLEILLVGGRDVEAWMPFEPQMDAWAQQYGCEAGRIPFARKGWLRPLSHWKVVGYVLERKF